MLYGGHGMARRIVCNHITDQIKKNMIVNISHYFITSVGGFGWSERACTFSWVLGWYFQSNVGWGIHPTDHVLLGNDGHC
jgi:hypothetical protein